MYIVYSIYGHIFIKKKIILNIMFHVYLDEPPIYMVIYIYCIYICTYMYIVYLCIYMYIIYICIDMDIYIHIYTYIYY